MLNLTPHPTAWTMMLVKPLAQGASNPQLWINTLTASSHVFACACVHTHNTFTFNFATCPGILFCPTTPLPYKPMSQPWDVE